MASLLLDAPLSTWTCKQWYRVREYATTNLAVEWQEWHAHSHGWFLGLIILFSDSDKCMGCNKKKSKSYMHMLIMIYEVAQWSLRVGWSSENLCLHIFWVLWDRMTYFSNRRFYLFSFTNATTDTTICLMPFKYSIMALDPSFVQRKS